MKKIGAFLFLFFFLASPVFGSSLWHQGYHHVNSVQSDTQAKKRDMVFENLVFIHLTKSPLIVHSPSGKEKKISCKQDGCPLVTLYDINTGNWIQFVPGNIWHASVSYDTTTSYTYTR